MNFLYKIFVGFFKVWSVIIFALLLLVPICFLILGYDISVLTFVLIFLSPLLFLLCLIWGVVFLRKVLNHKKDEPLVFPGSEKRFESLTYQKILPALLLIAALFFGFLGYRLWLLIGHLL